jgi:hypothetical protein
MALVVLGLMTVASIPTVIGVGQAMSAQKRQNAESKEQAKFHLTILFPTDDEAFCVLVDGKVCNSPKTAVECRVENRAGFGGGLLNRRDD